MSDKDAPRRAPGNGRKCEPELERAVDALLLLMERRSDTRIGLKTLLESFERNLIARALHESRGSQIKAARFLSLKATTLNQKIKRYGLRIHTYASIDCGPGNGRSSDNADGSACGPHEHGQSKLFVVK